MTQGTQRLRWGTKARWAIGLGLLMLATGCAGPEAATARSDEPIGLQMLRAEPELRQQRFSNLLGFEADSDAVFIAAEPVPARLDIRRSHTGQGSLLLPAGTRRVAVNVSSLLAGRPFPADWTLAGAYFRAAEAVSLNVAYEAGGGGRIDRDLTLAPGRWSAAMVDLTSLPISRASTEEAISGNLIFTFDKPLAAPVLCDDVMLVDNGRSLMSGDEPAPAGMGVWTIRQRGFQILVDQPGRFRMAVKTPEASADGWEVEEANAFRLRLRSAGRQKSWTIYASGRQYLDGQYDGSLEPDKRRAAAYAAQHRSPAEVSVPEELGRVDRGTRGDANNDGYNECSGCYELAASGARLEVTLSPRSAPLVRPVLEIAGLPKGVVLVTMEGQLVDGTLRLKDGHLLLELPAAIERPTTVNVRVR